jgi:hypothetical protein
MRKTKRALIISLLTAGGLMAGVNQAMAGSVTYNFDTDISTIPGLKIIANNNDTPWQSSGGNPASGGFLALCYPFTYMNTHLIFPDLDEGKLVTAFKFSCDLRVGNSEGTRAADGFSINFARAGDPVLANADLDPGRGYAGEQGDWFPGGGGEAASLPETGTTTGIAISFDTWSGNALPDGADTEGILVRVDNKTVLRKALPTRHGQCTDATSLQTGPRDTAFWATSPSADTAGRGIPEAWDTLCWQKLEVELDNLGKLTVKWKGTTILDKYQTTYFPTPGQLVFAGRTGGSDEQTHVDNLVLETTAVPGEKNPPTDPANLKASVTGARRIVLVWDESTDDSGRAAYRLEKNGVVIQPRLTEPTYEDRNVKPETTYNYRVQAYDVIQNNSAWVSASVTTVAEVPDPIFQVADVYDNISGTAWTDLVDDSDFPNNPNRGIYFNGLSFGEPGFGETAGDNFGLMVKGTLTVPENGQYHFFVRSDDASALFLNTSATIPNPKTDTPIATETDCCDAFLEPGDAGDGDGTSTTFTPISLTAGQQYGFAFIVKEGGGGDWGQVAWRKSGDTTPAASLPAINFSYLTGGKGDPVGALVKITQQPQAVTTVANEKVTFSAAADFTSPYRDNMVYQWYKNGAIIAGAGGTTTNSTSSIIPVVSTADNGAKFKVIFGVPGASEMSSEVTLTVNADNKLPAITKVDGAETFTQVTVTFSEPVTAPTATTAGNYALSGGVTVSAAQLVDQFNVRLTTSKMAEDTEFTLTVNNVQDNAGNAIAAGTQVKFKSWAMVPNRVKIERYNDPEPASATGVQTLLDNPNYPNSPNVTDYLTAMSFGEWTSFGDTYGDSYGARLTAFLIPKESGQYNFFIRSDDASQLYLSTSETFPVAGTDTPIAEETGCCNAFFEPGNAQTTANPISLTADKRYAIMFLVKEGGGGDWGQVAWRRTTDNTPAGDLPPLSDVVYWYGPPAAPAVEATIGIAPAAGGATITYTGILESADKVEGPYAPVAGATSPYSVPAETTVKFYRAAGQ